jgi:hypothetical protein
MPILQSFGNAAVRAFGWSRGSAGGATNSMELISTQILGTAASSVTFSSIPQTYKHLQLRMTVRNTSASTTGTVYMNPNNIANTLVSYHYMYGNGSSVSSSYIGSGNVYSYSISDWTPPANAPAGEFEALIVDLLDYTSTSKNKVSRTMAGYVDTTTKIVVMNSQLARTTSAITSLVISEGVANFAVGSRFSLYGVLG